MSRRKSVYLSDRSEEVIGEASLQENLSGRLNSIIDRYGAMISAARRSTLPLFTETERVRIREACLTWATTDEKAAALLGTFTTRIVDAIQIGLLREWSEGNPKESNELLTKVSGLHPIQQLALIDWLER